MDYEFQQDVTGHVIARFSMDHEAIGYWLNEEIKGDLCQLEQIQAGYHSIKGSGRQWKKIGREYTLFMDDEEIMIRANQLHFQTEDLEEGMCYYDSESIAFCGLDDFINMLENYRNFFLSNSIK